MRGKSRKTCSDLCARSAFVFALILLVAGSSLASAERLIMEYAFECPRVQEIVIGGELYHRVTMVDAPNSGNIGQPALPARGAKILLPLGLEVASIEIVPGEKVFLGSGYFIEPVAQPIKLSADPSEVSLPIPDPATYGSNRAFPEMQFERIGTHGFRGYQILTLKLQPVEYAPQSGELYYYPQLTVIVNTVDADQPAPLFRGLARDEEEARAKVDNPDIADTYAVAAKGLQSNFDLLILTTPTLTASFQPLKDYHDTTGILTEIHTIADVGTSNPDAVRDYITERYLNDGIQYVLIGGDDDLIPAKDLYVIAWVGGDVSYDMPGDIYFGCLDGTYNYDGDSRWGEPDDGEGGGDVDLIAEVYVGRASVGNTTEADRFVNKTIGYLAGDGIYLDKVLMCGEHLGFGGLSEYAGNMMDQMVNGSSADGYTTVGIPWQLFIIDRLYDRDWPGHDWPSSELISRINSGLHIINHLGHGSTNWAMKMTSGTAVSSMTNDDHCFIYSQACYSGQFDGADCWAENVNIKTDHGAFAVIMNARYGWGLSSSTDGPSQRFDREFWDAVFNPVEYTPQLGRANQRSKEDNLYRIHEACMRWCYYELILFGDPAVSIRFEQEEPEVAIDYPNGVPDTVRPYELASFEVTITGTYGGTPVPGSGQLHYVLNGEPVETVPMTEISPNHYEAVLPQVCCDDLLEFYVSAEEATSGRFYDPDPGSPYTTVVISEVIVIFEDDFGTHKGWTVSGDATDGHWQRGIPVSGGPHSDPRGDPPSDFDGSYLCYLTANEKGDSDVDDGTTYLGSPVFDLSAGDALIHYARWYSNDFGSDPHNDVFVVDISNDGGAIWTTAETVGPVNEASGGWYEHTFWASDIVTPTDQMKVHFAASDLGDSSIVEAAVDAFSVTVYACYDCDCTDYCDLDLDGAINPLDVVYIVNYVYYSLDMREQLPGCPNDNGDWNRDGGINPLDVVLYANYVYRGLGEGPSDPCVP